MKLKSLILRKLGIIRATYEAEFEIIGGIQALGIKGDQMDDITEIVMVAMKHIRG